MGGGAVGDHCRVVLLQPPARLRRDDPAAPQHVDTDHHADQREAGQQRLPAVDAECEHGQSRQRVGVCKHSVHAAEVGRRVLTVAYRAPGQPDRSADQQQQVGEEGGADRMSIDQSLRGQRHAAGDHRQHRQQVAATDEPVGGAALAQQGCAPEGGQRDRATGYVQRDENGVSGHGGAPFPEWTASVARRPATRQSRRSSAGGAGSHFVRPLHCIAHRARRSMGPPTQGPVHAHAPAVIAATAEPRRRGDAADGGAVDPERAGRPAPAGVAAAGRVHRRVPVDRHPR